MEKTSFKLGDVKNILIPTDGSEYSIRAAEYGISIAKVTGAQIMVVYVIDTIVLDQIEKETPKNSTEQELKKDGERYLNYILQLAEKEGIKAASMLARGRPFEQIVHLAKGLGINLIVMGTYGQRGAERILIGSVVERVIEYTTVPVLVVK